MPSSTFDLIVIGAGPGGYVCAIRAAQLGLKTALVEKDKHLGGTCLNVGCIPSKSLLHSTEQYAFLKHQGPRHGIVADNLKVDIQALMKKKDGVVNALRKGVQGLVAKNKIALFNGSGKLLGEGKVEVKNEQSTETLEASNIVIATGSQPVELPSLPFDGQRVISSDQAIALTEAPEKLVVVGGGAIGLELGSVWQRLGSAVTIIEFLPRIAAGLDEDITVAEAALREADNPNSAALKIRGTFNQQQAQRRGEGRQRRG